jgi:hypothetical protein
MIEIAVKPRRPTRRLGRAGAVAVSLSLLLLLAGAGLLARAVSLRDSVLPGVALLRLSQCDG